MKKLLYLLVFLLIVYFGLEFSFIKLSKGHNVEYKIVTNKSEFLVKEIYTHRKNELKSYYFEIDYNNNTFNFQTLENFKSANYIIKEIYSYSNDNYNCIYPIFKDERTVTDVICKKDNIQYLYNTIKGKDKQLDKFVSSLNNYNENNFKYSTKNKIEATPVTLYTDNIVDKHYLYLSNYRGIYLINKKDNIRNIELFNSDIYNNKINGIVNENYITANYNKDYKFNEFYLVNIKNGKRKEIISDKAISLDSYNQGSIDNDLYLFNRSDKIQYRINVKNKTVSKIGSTSKGIQLYKNQKFIVGSAYDAYNKELTFNKYSYSNKFNNKTYSKVDKVGNKISGYYYLYEKQDNYYNVYKVSMQNKNILTYLFKTTDINNIEYVEGYIYYKYGNNLYYYKDNLTSKVLLKNTEFEFNNTIKFGIFVD